MQTQRGASLANRTKLVLLALVVTALDQLTKFLLVSWIPEGGSRPVVDHVLWFSDFRNPGAAFGTLKGFSGVLALAALVGVIAFLAIVVRDPGRWSGVGAAVVAGGALGNLIDRIARGSVVDFIDFHFWPAFNVADSAITVGAIVILLAGLLDKKGQRDAPERA